MENQNQLNLEERLKLVLSYIRNLDKDELTLLELMTQDKIGNITLRNDELCIEKENIEYKFNKNNQARRMYKADASGFVAIASGFVSLEKFIANQDIFPFVWELITSVENFRIDPNKQKLIEQTEEKIKRMTIEMKKEMEKMQNAINQERQKLEALKDPEYYAQALKKALDYIKTLTSEQLESLAQKTTKDGDGKITCTEDNIQIDMGFIDKFNPSKYTFSIDGSVKIKKYTGEEDFSLEMFVNKNNSYTKLLLNGVEKIQKEQEQTMQQSSFNKQQQPKQKIQKPSNHEEIKEQEQKTQKPSNHEEIKEQEQTTRQSFNTQQKIQKPSNPIQANEETNFSSTKTEAMKYLEETEAMKYLEETFGVEKNDEKYNKKRQIIKNCIKQNSSQMDLSTLAAREKLINQIIEEQGINMA